MFDRFNIDHIEGLYKEADGEWVQFDDVKHLLERSDNKDYAKCYSEIIHIINTMAYPEASIKSVLKKHFA